VERVDPEPLGLESPLFADELVGREPLQGLQPTTEVVGGDEVRQVHAQLLVRGIIEPLDRGFLDGAVPALDLPLRPRMPRLGQPVRPIVLGAGEFERVGAKELLAGEHVLDLVRRPGIAAGLGEVGAIVGEHGVNPIGHGRDQVSKEVAGNAAGDPLMPLNEGELGRAVDRDQQRELALLGPHLREVDVEEADRVALELGPPRLVALCVGQPRDAVALQAPVQAGAGQVRDRGLERVKAVVQRQQRVAPERDDDGLLVKGQHRGARLLRTGAFVLDRGALLPLGNGLRVDAVALGQAPQALLTLLDRSTHRRRRAGAPMKNLAHSASFQSDEKSAPSKPGTKHLAHPAVGYPTLRSPGSSG